MGQIGTKVRHQNTKISRNFVVTGSLDRNEWGQSRQKYINKESRSPIIIIFLLTQRWEENNWMQVEKRVKNRSDWARFIIISSRCLQFPYCRWARRKSIIPFPAASLKNFTHSTYPHYKRGKLFHYFLLNTFSALKFTISNSEYFSRAESTCIFYYFGIKIKKYKRRRNFFLAAAALCAA